ncbi:MAG: phosphoribosyl-ATP pyrophosphohydrolase [Candidatus Saccharibacteria bacterium]|nr:phosphoribosyl-ATP pyrophosphohydrolase [Candidatus Saccharibacteria bacterium]MDB5180350.1 phosphoribosyl-ATP pyrophosphohydrolase [Candidatus Saccharibacteria bacterium]
MAEIIYNKLVRDNIPAIISNDNATPTQRILTNDDDYRKALLEKLVEEAKELLDSDGSLDERADIAEVLKAIDELLGYEATTIESARVDKANKRGSFSSRIYLEKVVTND